MSLCLSKEKLLIMKQFDQRGIIGFFVVTLLLLLLLFHTHLYIIRKKDTFSDSFIFKNLYIQYLLSLVNTVFNFEK
jgi:hypothetical protein